VIQKEENKEMSIEENKAIMQRYFDELMNNRDYSKADEILHPDYTGSAGGGLQGVEGHKQYTSWVHSVFSDLYWETLDMIAEEDKIAVFQKPRGIHEGEFQGVPGTGRSFSFDMVSVYEFKDGKVYRGLARIVSDTLIFYQQVGVLPSNDDFIKAYKEANNLE
jgi:predicted ester cyclase